MKYIALTGRILYSSIFLVASLGHFRSSTISFVESKGVPLASILVPLSGIMMIAGGLSILLGYKARIGAWILVLFLVPVTLTLHAFWTVADPMARQVDFAMFLKNIALIGTALLIAYAGTGPLSLDNRLSPA